MSVSSPGTLTAADYERMAQEYLRRLPLEHFMEGTPQATQREITVESFALLKNRRKDVYDRLVSMWLDWNATMLPEVDERATGANTGDRWADHIGAKPATTKADNPVPPRKPGGQ